MTDKTEPLPFLLPIEERESFKQIEHSPLAAAVRELRERFGLIGVVLIDFTAERVGVCHSGKTDEFNEHMATLGARILAAIDDGQFDPEDSDCDHRPMIAADIGCWQRQCQAGKWSGDMPMDCGWPDCGCDVLRSTL